MPPKKHKGSQLSTADYRNQLQHEGKNSKANVALIKTQYAEQNRTRVSTKRYFAEHSSRSTDETGFSWHTLEEGQEGRLVKLDLIFVEKRKDFGVHVGHL